MNKEEILKKAIEKAVDNGWQHPHLEKKNGEYIFWDAGLGEWGEYYEPNAYEIIFSHDFAKAFFGEETQAVIQEGEIEISSEKLAPVWKYHLQQMVLQEDPIEYLAKFI